MSSRYRPLIPAFATLILFASPAHSQQLSTAEGNVYGPDGKPILGAVVKFEKINVAYENGAGGSYGDSLSEGRDLGISARFSVKTDKKGYYYYGGLPFGVYQISVEVDGQVRAKIRTNLSPGRQEKDIDFNLKGPQAESNGPAESVGGQATAATKNDAQLAKSKDVNDLLNAGKTAVDSKQWESAIQTLTKAAELDPKQVPAWVSLADAYVGAAQSKPSESAANYDKAFTAYQKLIALKPNDAAVYNNYALALASAGKLDDARANLAKAVQLDPKGAGRYHYNLGVLLMNVAQNDAGLDEFRKSIDADPNYAEAQFQFGIALADKATTDASGKLIPPPGMEQAFRRYLELKPDGPNAQQAKAMIAMLSGK